MSWQPYISDHKIFVWKRKVGTDTVEKEKEEERKGREKGERR